MFTKILCPLDGSDHAKRALAVAIDMARDYGAELILIHALLRTADTDSLKHFARVEGLARDVEPEIRRQQSMGERVGLNLGHGYEDTAISSRLLIHLGERILENAKMKASEKGVKGVETLIVDGDPADMILRCIKHYDADGVVMGSRGLSDIKGLALGSVSHKVMNRAPCTCIAVK